MITYLSTTSSLGFNDNHEKQNYDDSGTVLMKFKLNFFNHYRACEKD